MPIKFKDVKSRRIMNMRGEGNSSLQIRGSQERVPPSVEDKSWIGNVYYLINFINFNQILEVLI